jgi:hypothetical protein
MPELRVWHPSRDAYHCVFRLVRIGLAAAGSLELERVRVLDMYLLYPPLLHRSSMPREVRRVFSELLIPRPAQTFVRLPSAAAIFQDLRLYQNSAITHLAARGLTAPAELQKGVLTIGRDSLPEELADRAEAKNSETAKLIEFLIGPYSSIPLRGPNNLYARSGLPTRSVLS